MNSKSEPSTLHFIFLLLNFYRRELRKKIKNGDAFRFSKKKNMDF